MKRLSVSVPHHTGPGEELVFESSLPELLLNLPLKVHCCAFAGH
jgi:hypothetical protein